LPQKSAPNKRRGDSGGGDWRCLHPPIKGGELLWKRAMTSSP
jgi:hypothetical protein